MKICTKCKTKLPATLMFFYKDVQKRDKLRPDCKRCIKKYQQSISGKLASRKSNKNYRQRYPERIKKQGKQYYGTINGHLRTVYYCIKRRCTNPKDIGYGYYGSRGIKNKFKSVNNFIDYVVNELQINPRGLQIDRIDNNGHYEKGNIRFVTRSENCKNRRKRRC